jgi:hypothetical protein
MAGALSVAPAFALEPQRWNYQPPRESARGSRISLIR